MIDDLLVSDVLSEVLTGGDFAEVYAEDTHQCVIDMSSGSVRQATSGRLRGIGVRGFADTRGIYSYTNDFSPDAGREAARRVASVLGGEAGGPAELVPAMPSQGDRVRISPNSVEIARKVDVMRRAHAAAMAFSPLVADVQVTYLDVEQDVLVANSEGVSTTDRRTRTRMAVRVVAQADGERETGFFGPGASRGFEFFDGIDPEAVGREAARIAVQAVQAQYAPAGRMPVVISNAFGGVIFHEACGHALEATSVAIGSSVFTGKIGTPIASEVVSAVDDGRIPHAWGTSAVDDEGTPTRRTVLIENGVLKSYMVDRLGARKMQTEATGNGRRQSYAFAPTSRMTNTFILPGPHVPEEIIAATDYGFFAKTLGGGQVNPSTGEFNFVVLEGYLIEKGRITKPLRGATLIGKGHEILPAIDMVANDLLRAQGMCGSMSGSIPADVGQPTLRVSDMTVGGRNK